MPERQSPAGLHRPPQTETAGSDTVHRVRPGGHHDHSHASVALMVWVIDTHGHVAPRERQHQRDSKQESPDHVSELSSAAGVAGAAVVVEAGAAVMALREVFAAVTALSSAVTLSIID